MPTAVPMPPMPRRAGFTIASRDRIEPARLLSRQYMRYHPEQRFFIILADDLGESPLEGGEDGVIPLGAIPVPGADVFPYQHAMRPHCSVIKPFCARYLLAFDTVDELVYVDADIALFRRLDPVWDAMGGANLVLTPHTNEPIGDFAPPSDLTFLQRGQFNSGFIAMKDNAITRSFLDWWCDRVYSGHPTEAGDTNCLDQKWLDLAPIYFDDIHILRDVTCNVAFWNLHERVLSASEGNYLVNGQPLCFFHFSGFDPECPDRLSVHQSRYALSELPVLKKLCAEYARRFENSQGPAFKLEGDACLMLANGIPMSRVASAVVLKCVRNRIAFPAPGSEPDAFCRFITTPNPAVFGTDVAPLITALVDIRSDVEDAFPDARLDKHDQGISDWLETCGAEEQLDLLLQRFGRNLRGSSPLERALAIYRRRGDLQLAFPDLFADEDSFDAYGRWMDNHGRHEDAVDDDMLSAYRRAPEGFRRVLQQFFAHADLRDEFEVLYQETTITRLVARISGEISRYPSIDSDDLVAFKAFATPRKKQLLQACLRYNPRVRGRIGGAPSLLNAVAIESLLRRHRAIDELPGLVQSLLQGDWISLPSQLRSYLFAAGQNGPADELAGPLRVDKIRAALDLVTQHLPNVTPSQGEAWVDHALRASKPPLSPGVNLHGPLLDATGMGEWARSYSRILDAGRIAHCHIPFPSRFPTPEALRSAALPALFGSVDESMDINLLLANADSVAAVRTWLPDHWLEGRCNVGCWIWETEVLPARFSTASQGIHAIITPSQYSVSAIRASVDIPVYKVRCALDFEILEAASSRRASFGLPADATLFGFFFDAKSVIERKNPAGLIDAFRNAFGSRKDVGLVLKVNSAEPGNIDYDSLKLRASGLNVFWIERTLSMADTLDLMASLDVYASLHRSEGFGLTMAEAMALGKPVIASGYSGNMEFMDAASAALVDCTVITTTRAHAPYQAGSRWAEPSIEHCASWMRSLEDPVQRERIGVAGRARVRKLLDPTRVALEMSDVLQRIRRDWRADVDPLEAGFG